MVLIACLVLLNIVQFIQECSSILELNRCLQEGLMLYASHFSIFFSSLIYFFSPLFFYSINGIVSEQSYSVTIAYSTQTVVAFCCALNSN